MRHIQTRRVVLATSAFFVVVAAVFAALRNI
jgi:hypothetical protein